MDYNINLHSIPLSWLTNESRTLLSNLLNGTKIFTSEGPEKLPRYWLGLASLAGISAEIAVTINMHPNKTANVLEIWESCNPTTANVGCLLQYLQRMDRFDVYDDCIELHKQGKFFVKPSEKNARVCLDIPEDDRLITYEDRRTGEPQFYHAYVVYAQEDKDFVDYLLTKMRAAGFRLCTEDDLLPGHATQYEPISRLISERCHRIILVYSPDFLKCPANSYYTNYAQAVSIERKQLKLLPLMYRHCQLPVPMCYYHTLFYTPPGQKAPYDFWQKLSNTLETPKARIPSLSSTSSDHSSININEVNRTFETKDSNCCSDNKPLYLQLPSVPSLKSISMTGLNTCEKILIDDSKSLSELSHLSDGKQKKQNKIRTFIKTCKKKLTKKAIVVVDG
ncbi:myeloid differentiation primary response protein MyD88 [Battus philenor]|uniref:myeloid differentiation primary response protein MyD88 n=1 Tax=Battus philenor TaxID=42288 RepID=UPI0035CFEA0B